MNEFENALKALRPAAELERDQLMYRAGQASAGRRGWIWRVATLSMTGVAGVLACVLVLRPQPAPEERVVFVSVPQQAPVESGLQKTLPEPPRMVVMEHDAPPLSVPYHGAQLWQMEQQALRWGVESLPLPALPEASGDQPKTLGSLMNDLANGKFGKGLER